MDVWAQLIWNSIFFALPLSLVAASFSLIYSVTRVLHVAHGAVALLAGYVFWALLRAGSPFPVAVVAGIAASVVAGVLAHLAVYEPMRRRRALSSTGALIASLALLVIGINTVLAFWGSSTHRIASPLDELPTFTVLGARIAPLALVIIGVSIVCLAALGALIKWTRLGTAMRATSDYEEIAEIVGIDTRRIRLTAFAIGSGLAGVAGVLGGLLYHLEPNKATFYALEAFSRAIVGGLGSVGGAVIASFGMQFAQNIGGFLWISAFQDFLSFALAFVFLLVRPQGIFGKRSL